jgi:hypothetical protein
MLSSTSMLSGSVFGDFGSFGSFGTNGIFLEGDASSSLGARKSHSLLSSKCGSANILLSCCCVILERPRIFLELCFLRRTLEFVPAATVVVAAMNRSGDNMRNIRRLLRIMVAFGYLLPYYTFH